MESNQSQTTATIKFTLMRILLKIYLTIWSMEL